jgi:hypothetical protein
MKMRAEVIAVETTGEKITVTMQAVSDGDADWRPMNVITLQCADKETNRKSFHLGRIFSLIVRPR